MILKFTSQPLLSARAWITCAAQMRHRFVHVFLHSLPRVRLSSGWEDAGPFGPLASRMLWTPPCTYSMPVPVTAVPVVVFALTL